MTNKEGATRAIAHGLDSALRRKLKVLWLLSGGSNIAVQLDILRQLEHADAERLTISLIDERFVPLDSPASNWRALLDGGLASGKARLEPPILEEGLDLQAAADDWASRLGKCMGEADLIIGQFGIGSDGHTAGILPHTQGVHEHDKLVVGYQGSDFERLTTTPAAFARMGLAVAVAFGDDKRPIIERIPSEVSPDEQPAQLLLLAPELIIYTDQKVEWT